MSQHELQDIYMCVYMYVCMYHVGQLTNVRSRYSAVVFCLLNQSLTLSFHQVLMLVILTVLVKVSDVFPFVRSMNNQLLAFMLLALVLPKTHTQSLHNMCTGRRCPYT